MQTDFWSLAAAYLSGNANDEQTKTLFAWLEAHPEYWEELAEAKVLWNAKKALDTPFTAPASQVFFEN
jgi:hypothetical protein